jgi:hypothetical protein
MKRPSIPAVNISDRQLAGILKPLKEAVEVLGGVRGEQIKKLSFVRKSPEFLNAIDSTDEDYLMLLKMRDHHQQIIEIADKINEIIDRLSP